ncbi:MAG TPA: S8 family serine peptidase [Vicinamibacteria bacterium]|nr:S8 family serine peptidase [Vicinamibacteria bacterium]
MSATFPADRASGRGVRVALIDSGVHASHPHVGGVAGGVGFDARGQPSDDFVDRLGHGTAVAAVVREKAPLATLYALKVFDRALRTEIGALRAALDWAIAERVALVNLSLGTTEDAHEGVLRGCVERARDSGVLIVSALRTPEGQSFLPGRLPGVLPVELDSDCPRDSAREAVSPDGSVFWRASPYPRPIDGVPPERNLKGLSFAVANVTGLLAALVRPGHPLDLAEARRCLAAASARGGRV